MISPSIPLPPKFGIANLRKIRPLGNILSANSIAFDLTLNGSLVGAVKMPVTLANNIDSLSLFFSSYIVDKKSVVLILCIFTSFVAVPRDFVSRGKYVFDPSLVAKLKNMKIFALMID